MNTLANADRRGLLARDEGPAQRHLSPPVYVGAASVTSVCRRDTAPRARAAVPPPLERKRHDHHHHRRSPGTEPHCSRLPGHAHRGHHHDRRRVVLAIAGATTWFTVQSNLADERITVSEDSPRFANDAVDGPFTAFQEAQMIEKHYLEATKGKTYAELDREDPIRETAMTASFLRASLFTSVVSFGIAAMAFGLGIVLAILGYGLLMMTREPTART